MAIRLTGRFTSPHNTEYQVDIYDGDFSGVATDFDVNFCRITYDGGGNDHYAPIIGSRAEIGISVHYLDTIIPTFIEDYAGGAEDRFYVRISRVLGSTTVWVGLMTPDFAGEEDTAPIYIFKVSAVCGLAMLKSVPYHDGSAIYTGLVRILSHLQNSLAKLTHTNLFWGSSDIFIKTAIDWWEESMTYGADSDPLYQGAIDHAAFYAFGTSGSVDKDVISCYSVIEHVLKAFNARIMQVDGVWWIEQIPYRTTTPYYTRHYDKTGVFLSSAINSNANVVNQTKFGAKIATVNYDFIPALKWVELTYKVNSRRNFLDKWTLTNNTIVQDISDNSGTATGRLRFTFLWVVYDLTSSYSPLSQYILNPVFTLRVGERYLSRLTAIINWQYAFNNFTWQSAGDPIIEFSYPIMIGPIAPGGVNFGSVEIDLAMPALEVSADDIELSLSSDFYLYPDGSDLNPMPSADFSNNNRIQNPYLEFNDNGTPFTTEDEILYRSTNPSPATATYEINTIIGTAWSANSVGRIKVYDGAEWVNGGFWGSGVDPRTIELSQLLADNLLYGRAAPIRRLSGDLFGDFKPNRLLNTTDGKKWIMVNGKFDLGSGNISGSWVELQYGSGGIHATPVPIKIIQPGGSPTIDPAPPNGGVTSNTTGFYTNPAPTVLKPIAFNYTTSDIAAGATVTSIPIGIASFGNEFLAGDGVTIVNPITGNFQTFEIATAPALGDTSLIVTSEASSYDFPENAYLVVKQNAYAFTPGNWYTHKGTISSNKVIVSGFTLPSNINAIFPVVRKQWMEPTDDFTVDYMDNSVNFAAGLGLNGQIAYIRAYA